MSASSTAAPPAQAPPRYGHRPGVVLALIVTCYMMIIVDNNVMTIALPKIQAGLHFTPTALSWVLSSYMLTFGGLLLLGGRAGDLFGRRRVFVAGVVLFTISSLLGGMAVTSWQLLAARAVQGVGAALASPGAMSLLITNFAEGAPRNRALAVYATAAGLGQTLGMILGGVVTEWTSWRWVLFVNVPFGVAVAVLTPLFVTEPRRGAGRLDLAGALSGTAGMAALVYGFIRAASTGWDDGVTIGAFAVALVLLAVFVVVQVRVAHPTMPLRLFHDRNRATGYATVLLTMACLFSVLFFVSQFLQDVLGFGALATGLAFLPMSLGTFVTSRFTPRLLPRTGAMPLIVTGLLLVVGAAFWLSRLDAGTPYSPHLLVPILMFGVGIGAFLMPLNATILAGVGPADAGAASGIMQTMQQIGGSLGLAVLVTVYGTSLRQARTSDHAQALAQAMGTAFLFATVFVGIALVLVAVLIRTPRRAG
ncbi:MFS transporter [Microbispora sp. KK1-11]|uniref:MFS transporter n=1 Tax=Microbispora sp. KK1-11 TaxID=2053005 RepID=UPI001159ED6E|nr:MFS transporter [Microbispora sp. KK1-11]TQS26186.1 MFS transporter [Microbispora sp. KK1-11]